MRYRLHGQLILIPNPEQTLRKIRYWSIGGDIPAEHNFEDFSQTVENTVGSAIKSGSVPVVLGGDHSITYPVIKGIRSVYDEINIIWLDSHPDIYPEYEGDPYSHACPLSRILELGGIGEVCQGGIRAATRVLNKRLQDAGVTVYTINELSRMSGLKLPGKTYLTIDIDVLDPAFAPGAGTPVPGGVSTRELINLIHSFDIDIAGFDVVEVNPAFDHAQITAAAAAKIVMETIGSIVSSRSRK
ncbi:agmatinase [candidate division KSB1 bacterium]